MNYGRIYNGYENYRTNHKRGTHVGMVEYLVNMATEILLEYLKGEAHSCNIL